MMPKGVEHILCSVFWYFFCDVFHSLMPKGVEHTTREDFRSKHVPVFHSLMPKGVEHTIVECRGVDCKGVSFVDAERR